MIISSERRRARRAQRAVRRASARPLRRALLWIGGVALVVLGVLGLFGAVRLATVARDLDDAAELVASASDDIEAGQLGRAREQLGRAHELLVTSNDRLYHHPSLDVLGALPVFHQNLEALRDTVGLALRLVDGGGRILEVTEPYEGPDGTLEIPLRGGSVPLDAVRTIQSIADELAGVIPGPGFEPSTSLLADPVARAQQMVIEEAAFRRHQLQAAASGLDLLAALAGDGGHRRYLIAVANTAEMRGAGGMILSYGILEADNGSFVLGEFGGIDDLALSEPVDPLELGLPADYLHRWEGLEPTFLWRNTTLFPDLAFDARVMQAMYSARSGQPLHGVIQIDPAGLAAILEGTGPVHVDGLGQVDASNVVDLTLNRAYIEFPDRDERQEVLGDVAEAAFDALVSGDFGSLRPLGEALYDAAQARHIIVYLHDPDAQAAAASFGATGEIPPADELDHLLLTVQNFSKNKLDYYLDTSLAVTGARPAGQPGSLSATVTITNTAPVDGTADYVFGPNAPGEVAGLYRGLVSLYVPTGTTVVGSAGESLSPPVLTTEAGRSVVGFDVEVPAGETRTVTVELALAPRPPGAYQLTLVPVPRVRPTVVSVVIDVDGAAVGREAAPLVVPEVHVPIG